jgi:Na+/melibiose symporter-like transporter
VPPPGGFTPASPLGTSSGSGSNGLAVAALVVGIISLIGIFCFGVGGILFGLVAVVLGVLGMKKANAQPGAPQKGLAIGGIVTGALGLLIGIVILVFFVVVGSTADDIQTDFESDFGEINSDPSDGVCDESRFLQDPDC